MHSADQYKTTRITYRLVGKSFPFSVKKRITLLTKHGAARRYRETSRDSLVCLGGSDTVPSGANFKRQTFQIT